MINFADVFGVKYPLRLIIDGIKRSMIKKNRKDQILMKTENEDISMLAEIDTNPVEVTKEELDQVFPVMTLRNLIMFPSVVMPVTVGRQSTLKLVNTALKKKSSIVITTQKVSEVEAPGFKDLYPVAVIGKVLRIFEMPGGNTTVILQSNGPKVNLDEITATRPYLQGKVSLIEEDMQVEKSDEMKALMDTCRELSTKYVEASERMSPDTAFAIKNLDEPEILVNFICTNFPFSQEDRYALLCINNLKDRLYRLIQVLNKEVQLATLKQNIQMRTREDLDRQQREYFLQQQIKNIQDELGNGQNDEVEELREKASHKKWRREVGETFEKEVSKLERINPQSPDYNVQLTYLQTLLALPWDVYTDDVINIPNAEKVLNKDHYGLEKVKERILEHLAVKLPVSRLQRDLTDSTVLRNVGVPFGHIVIAIQSSLKGLRKLLLNEPAIYRDLDNCWSVVAEAIQTILRREAYPHPYEALKALTRTNQAITESSIKEFIEGLNVSEDIKKELRAITPHTYTGL